MEIFTWRYLSYKIRTLYYYKKIHNAKTPEFLGNKLPSIEDIEKRLAKNLK